MKNIERAHSDYNDRFEYFQNKLNNKIKLIEERGYPMFETTIHRYNLDDFFKGALDDFNESCLGTGQDRELQIRLLSHYHTLAKAFFKLAYNEGKEVEVNFTGTPVKHIGREYKSGVGFLDWLKAWGVFTVFDDREGLELLQSIPDSVMDKANLKWHQLDRSIFAMLKNIYNPSVDMHALIIRAMKDTDANEFPFLKDNEALEWVLYNFEPLIRVYEALFRRNEKDFNETLIEALELHKKYWGDEKSTRNNESDGWISWLLLAPAATAVRFGMKLEVTSDYIPEWLVNGLDN
jgi:hypothetical protein